MSAGNLVFDGADLNLDEWVPEVPSYPTSISIDADQNYILNNYGRSPSSAGYLDDPPVTVNKNSNYSGYPVVYSEKNYFISNGTQRPVCFLLWTDDDIQWNLLLISCSYPTISDAAWNYVIPGFLSNGVSYIDTANAYNSQYFAAALWTNSNQTGSYTFQQLDVAGGLQDPWDEHWITWVTIS